MNKGNLELIIGPMYACKSTELLRRINMYEFLDKKIIVINHNINNRYGSSNLSTHNREYYNKCINLDKLKEFEKYNIFNEIEIIIIEELQFFSDAFEIVKKWTDIDNKNIIAAGLDGDFERKPFGDVLKLIPYAEKVTKLNALCKKCNDGSIACFTKRITNKKDKTLVGSCDIYEAVCRKHYLE